MFAQVNLKGSVINSESKFPLPNVRVTLADKTISTKSDISGNFSLPVSGDGNYTIRLTSIGYKTSEMQINVNGGSYDKIVIPLIEDAFTISEIDVNSTKEYGTTSINMFDVKLRPVNSSQDLLRLVPGLIVAQHAGGGKAEQMFLRGFDIDHGTDIAISVDGMPVNMVSHAHGQGYADLHFVIPETIEEFNVFKGPYKTSIGDLSTSGAVVFSTKNVLQRSLVQLETGLFNSYRGVALIDILRGKHLFSNKMESLYLASEYVSSDGYFDNKQKFSRVNVFGKYFGMLSNNTSLSLTGSTFTSHWDASGQIPTRAVNDGSIGRYGSVDPSEGGETGRTNVNLILNSALSNNSEIKQQLYYTNYRFNLYSNFTFFLNNPVNGDEINQSEHRNIYGYNGSFSFNKRSGNTNFKTTLGAGARIDDIGEIYLANTEKRNFVSFFGNGKLTEKNISGYVDEVIEAGKLVINPGIRADHFDFLYTDYLAAGLESSKNDFRVSPKLNVYYNVDPKLQFYIKSGIGFHSNDSRVVVRKQLENTLPRAYGYETGTSFTSGNLLVNASVWGLDLESEFVYVGDAAVVEPSGRTRRLGLDVSGRYQFTDWLWADIDLDYAHGRFLDEIEGQDYIPLAPDFTSIGGVSFKLKQGFNGSLRYRLVNERPANSDNSTRAKGYFIMDAVINYTTSRYQIGFAVENLLNNRSWNEAQFDTESRLFNEKTSVTELHYTPGTPLSLKGKMTFYF